MTRHLLTSLAQTLPATIPFVGPEAIERRLHAPLRARIGANESPFGPAQSVIVAMQEAASGVWQYCDPEIHDLRTALSRHLRLPTANICVGEGIDALHGLIARLVIEPGDVAVTSLGAYPTFAYHVRGFGGDVLTVPYRHDHEDLAALAEAVRRSHARVVYLANPDNPMGTCWNACQIADFIEELPEDTLLVLDEAYAETAPRTALPAFDISRPNVIRTRTFSKAYGLAGMRVGYAVGEAGMISAFDKVRNHFGVTRMGQIAAIAALADQDWLHHVVAQVIAGKEQIAAAAAEHGLRHIPSAANFMAIDCGRDGAFALAVLKALESRGVFVRKPLAPGLDRCIRVSVGRPEELDIFAEELPRALAAASA